MIYSNELLDEVQKTISLITVELADNMNQIQLESLELAHKLLSERFETRVYCINSEDYDYDADKNIEIYLLTDSQFMDIAEEQGLCYTLEGFQKAFNESSELNLTTDVIRFIQVPVSK